MAPGHVRQGVALRRELRHGVAVPSPLRLLRIARNAAIDHVAATRRQPDPTEPDAAVLVDLQSGDGDVGSEVDDLSVVADGLRALPVEQCNTLMAATYHGLTAREISEAWTFRWGTVKTRLRLTLARLRDQLMEVAR